MEAEQLEERLANLPTGPGVYLMKDRQGEVVYVGKAVNLRNRVRSYFTRTTGDNRAFIPFLGGLLGDIETVLVHSEKDALLLENELVKKHQPRFNVKLRDDKNFICLRLDTTQDYPRLEVVRRFKSDGARYFGPYSSASAIRETLRIVNRFFQLRTCSDYALTHRKRPCLLYQIGRCPAPCVYAVPRELYHESVTEVTLFLEGRGTELVEALKARMKKASAELRFEDAARLRDQVYAIQRSLERQSIATIDPVDQDVFGRYREGDRLLIYVLYVRLGRITGGQSFYFTGQEFPDEELIASFVNLYYDQENFVPEQVLLPVDPEGEDALAEVLTDRKGQKVRVLVPRRGEKHELVLMAAKNAEQAFQERKRSREETAQILDRLKDKLALRKVPHRIECFDISHFQGASIVASQVASVDGELDKSNYRRFKIKTVGQNDDFASMHEVLSRRVKRGLKDADLPDLFVIDGGKGQLASAHAALKDHGVEGVDVVSLAKSREEGEPGEDRAAPAVRSPERVFLLNRKDPVVLPQNSAELFVLTRLRDEAHRFAITFQQKLMRRKNFRSVLEDIPGVGQGRKTALLKHFGSLKRIREASIEELAEVIGPAVAERVHAYLHGAGGEAMPSEPEPNELQEVEREPHDTVRESSLEDAEARPEGPSDPRP